MQAPLSDKHAPFHARQFVKEINFRASLTHRPFSSWKAVEVELQFVKKIIIKKKNYVITRIHAIDNI